MHQKQPPANVAFSSRPEALRPSRAGALAAAAVVTTNVAMSKIPTAIRVHMALSLIKLPFRSQGPEIGRNIS
jgi:hypothetical protein